jgi:arylsulfatase A-like enzyme
MEVSTKKKNVILIIADDLGVRDLGCYNPKDTSRFYETPHLDQLAADGVLFENGYSADATCPRSRAGIFTGIHPSRLGAVDTDRLYTTGFKKEFECFRKVTPDNKQKIPLSAITIAEAFKQHDYTTALVGKWHSGNATSGLPADHGFDITIGNATELNTFFAPYACGTSKCHKVPVPSNLSQVPAGTHMTDHLTMDAIELLKDFKSGQNPFFLVFSHYAVHTPIESKNDDKDHFQEKRDLLPGDELDQYEEVDGLLERQTQDSPSYAGLLKSLDDSVGNLTQALETLGLANDTILLFTSDNGGKAANYNWGRFRVCLTSNYPFKQGKEYIGDGGIRVPLLIKAPGQIPPNTRTHFQSHGTDYYPTLLELAGLPLMPEDHVDGISLVPAITGEVDKVTSWTVHSREAPMFWQDPEECFLSGNCTDTSFAIVLGNWKLLKRIYSPDDFTLELYDIETDPGERMDLSATLKNGTRELHLQLLEWEQNWFRSPFYEKLSAEHGCA